jgi:cytochrome b6-f complex iron-sulfur subunit
MVGIKRLMEDSREITRRSFLAVVGWGAFVVASVGALYESLKFIFPNALIEDPPAFKADRPSEYAVGSTTVITDKRVVINRDPDGFYAISLICTHLGCTPRFFSDVTSDLVEQGVTGLRATKANPVIEGFKCPCHGSRYYRDAINFFGPAPRPMDRLHVEVARDGRLLVDRSNIVDRSFRLKV